MASIKRATKAWSFNVTVVLLPSTPDKLSYRVDVYQPLLPFVDDGFTVVVVSDAV
ncbi:hypothetical protein [Paenibacillus andongensis]|uniref:hypothetical protein n=1 Tax=Paenibacillus andongensis TaxID=2975482 RepID=UPI0021BB7B15|nr:hypothetical protein [Paenibacillus andongensis]